MAAEPAQNSGGQRIFLLVAVIVLLVAGWTGAWFWGASALDARFADAATRIASRGGALECPGRDIRGFPFRIGVHCDRFAYASPRGGSIEAGELRTAAQLYAPGRLVGELDGPAEITTPDRQRFALAWELGRMSGRAGLSGPTAFSLLLDQPKLASADGAPVGEALRAQLHLRRNPQKAEDLDVAFSGESVEPSEPRVAPFSLSGDLLLAGLAAELRPGFDLGEHVRRNGLSGEARSLVLSPVAGGSLSVSGPFSVTPDGVADGELTLSASDIPAMARFVSALVPDRREEIEGGAGIVASLMPAPEEGKAPPSIRVTIRKGRIVLGLLPLGQLPPLW